MTFRFRYFLQVTHLGRHSHFLLKQLRFLMNTLTRSPNENAHRIVTRSSTVQNSNINVSFPIYMLMDVLAVHTSQMGTVSCGVSKLITSLNHASILKMLAGSHTYHERNIDDDFQWASINKPMPLRHN